MVGRFEHQAPLHDIRAHLSQIGSHLVVRSLARSAFAAFSPRALQQRTRHRLVADY